MVKIKSAYPEPGYIDRQDLINDLNAQKKDIQTELNKINAR